MDRALKIIIVSRIAIFLFILFVIGLFNFPALFIEEPVLYKSYFNFLSFINNIILVLLAIGVFSVISGILWHLNFPSRLFAPLASTALALLSVEMLYRTFILVEKTFIDSGFDMNLRIYYIIILILALVISYFKLYTEMPREYKNKIISQKPKKENSLKISEEYSRQKDIQKTPPKQETKPEPKQRSEAKKEDVSQREFFEQRQEQEKPDGIKEKFQEAIYTGVEKVAGGIISFIDALVSSGKR